MSISVYQSSPAWPPMTQYLANWNAMRPASLSQIGGHAHRLVHIPQGILGHDAVVGFT
nr:hypothetical protein [Oleiphilus messinensis]